MLRGTILTVNGSIFSMKIVGVLYSIIALNTAWIENRVLYCGTLVSDGRTVYSHLRWSGYWLAHINP